MRIWGGLKTARIAFAAGTISIAVTGCVKYASVSKDAVFGDNYGEGIFEFGVGDSVGFGHATTQEYRVGPTENMTDSAVVKIFTWAAKNPKSFLLEANKRTYVFATMDRGYGAPGITDSGSNLCKNASSFTPQPNARYRLIQTGSAYGECELSIMDMKTNTVPADLEKIFFPIPETQN